MGYDAFNVGPEAEFFLFQTDDEGKPTTKTNDEAGYFDLGPLDHGEGTRREICLALEQMGFEIEASHHEVAQGQHEIDFKYADALRTADNIMTFKLAVKTLAQKQRPARHLHAQAHLRHQWLRHAHQHVPVPGRQERLLRSQTTRGGSPRRHTASSPACWPMSRAWRR